MSDVFCVKKVMVSGNGTHTYKDAQPVIRMGNYNSNINEFDQGFLDIWDEESLVAHCRQIYGLAAGHLWKAYPYEKSLEK